MAKNKPKATPSTGLQWLPEASLAALAAAVFLNSLAGGFITDDKLQLAANPLVTDPARWTGAFTSGVWDFLGYKSNYYRPLQILIYSAVYHTLGPGPAAFHLLMLALHALNTVLAFRLARRLLDNPRAAWIAGAIFALHPIHTEAVNWIAALPDVLVTTLALAGLTAFAAGRPQGAMAAPLHGVIYLLALFTKETGVMIAPLYAAYEWIVARRSPKNSWRIYAAMAASLALYLALRVHALGGLAPSQQTHHHLSAPEFVMSAATILGQYLAYLIWPPQLNFFHIFEATTSPTPVLAASVLAIGTLLWAALRFRSTLPSATFGILWILLAIAPALNLTGVGQNVFAERYLYLPSIGFAWLAALAWMRLDARRPTWARALAAVLLIVFAARAWARNADWTDDATLLAHTLQQSPTAAYLHNQMAGVWVEKRDIAKAVEEQRLAVRYDPAAPAYHKNLGILLVDTDPAAAAAEFETLVRLEPDLAQGHYDLGVAYEGMHQPERAVSAYRRAIALAPAYAEAIEALRRLQPK
ncbi:MAG: tetratricopeptide repeat protein [Acidobacteria bacterium]|nr:tetratricopeptide repeat protein [Acidobacteriota bacterium]